MARVFSTNHIAKESKTAKLKQSWITLTTFVIILTVSVAQLVELGRTTHGLILAFTTVLADPFCRVNKVIINFPFFVVPRLRGMLDIFLSSFLIFVADIKAQKNLEHKRQVIDTTLLKCYLQVGTVGI